MSFQFLIIPVLLFERVLLSKSLEIINQHISWQNITCDINSDCIIHCSSDGLCRNTIINCNNVNGKCELYCNGYRACQGLTFISTNAIAVNITCQSSIYNENCLSIVAQIGLKDEMSTVMIRCDGNSACFDGMFMIDTPTLNINSDNNILSNDMPRIYAECIGIDSCNNGIISVTGLNYFEMNCFGNTSCDELGLTLVSLNDEISGILELNCHGSYSCEDSVIDATTLEAVNINCFEGSVPCHNIQVYCPIYPFGLITNDSNNDLYYNYANINPNTCNINLDFGGHSTEIYTPYGTIAANVNGVQPGSQVEVYCEFDWWSEYFYLINTFSQPFGDTCNDEELIQTNYIDFIKNYPDNFVVKYPRSNGLSCDGIDCILYINHQLHTWISPVLINCPNISCTILCMNSYACRDATINAENTKSLKIIAHERTRFSAMGMNILAPNGDDTSLVIWSDHARGSFQSATIYANNTAKIELIGKEPNRFRKLILYAYHASSIYIDCSQGIASTCRDMEIFIHEEQFSIASPYPANRLHIKCINQFECDNIKVIISYPNSFSWTCTFHYGVSSSKWFCGQYEVPFNTPNPTLSPSQNPTKITNTPTLFPTDVPTIKTVTPTIKTVNPTRITPNPTILTHNPTHNPNISVNNVPENDSLYVVWLITAIMGGLCILVSIIFIGFCGYVYGQKTRKHSCDAIADKLSPQKANSSSTNNTIVDKEIKPTGVDFSNEYGEKTPPLSVSSKQRRNEGINNKQIIILNYDDNNSDDDVHIISYNNNITLK